VVMMENVDEGRARISASTPDLAQLSHIIPTADMRAQMITYLQSIYM
jgi:hypothetical protein